MSDLHTRLTGAREALDPPWDDARAERARAGLRARGRRRTAARAGSALAATGLLVALLATRMGGRSLHPEEALGEAGVEARALQPGTELRVVERSDRAVTADVARGSVSFRVARRGGRVFRVRAGAATVQVLGTEFVVARSGDGAHVRVSEGRVRVFWTGHYEDLSAGESGEYPRAIPEARATAVAAETAETAETAEATATPPTPSALATSREARVRARAPSAEDAQAEAVLIAQGLLASDPVGAAQTFARARSLAPNGQLAQEALAQEALAWRRAGDDGRARAAAERYLRANPTGAFVERVRAVVASP